MIYTPAANRGTIIVENAVELPFDTAIFYMQMCFAIGFQLSSSCICRFFASKKLCPLTVETTVYQNRGLRHICLSFIIVKAPGFSNPRIHGALTTKGLFNK